MHLMILLFLFEVYMFSVLFSYGVVSLFLNNYVTVACGTSHSSMWGNLAHCAVSPTNRVISCSMERERSKQTLGCVSSTSLPRAEGGLRNEVGCEKRGVGMCWVVTTDGRCCGSEMSGSLVAVAEPAYNLSTGRLRCKLEPIRPGGKTGNSISSITSIKGGMR